MKYVFRKKYLPHNSDYVVFFIFSSAKAPISAPVRGTFPKYHTMFVKGFCEIFLKNFSTPQ